MMDSDHDDDSVTRIARQLNALSASVDKRFDETAEALAGQRRYTEFAFEQVTGEMRRGFDRLERKLDRVIRHAIKEE